MFRHSRRATASANKHSRVADAHAAAEDCHEGGPPLVTRSVVITNRAPRRPASHVARWTRPKSKEARRLSALRAWRAPGPARGPTRRRLAEDVRPLHRGGPPPADL